MNRLERRCNSRKIRLSVKRYSIQLAISDRFYNNPEARWNGRQIRNACQTALALAEFEAQGGTGEVPLGPNTNVTLDVRHFEAVAKSYLGFIEYLTEIYGVNLDQRAKENQTRAGVRNDEAANISLRCMNHLEGSIAQRFMSNQRPWNPAQAAPTTPHPI
ncbi:hypothetical protein F5Y17DRAFT_350740 [Xylariaceae sp. FL0594]|nr:hypothetical protein F5Y17DRAFT_350740 [Xylariaceae sp. FL0594]